MIAGIDNGLTGGIVTINDDGDVIDKFVTPTRKLKMGKKTRVVFDLPAIAALCRGGFMDCKIVAVEKGQPLPPKMRGGNADFSSGYSFGMWCAMLTAFEVPHIIVSPRRWQSRFLKDEPGTDSKQRAIARAQRLLPGEDWTATERSRKPHSGLVDAYFLALYALRYE